jgi:hypothetical protein
VSINFLPPDIEQSGERGAQVVQIDSGKHVAAVAVCAAICGLAAALSIAALTTALHAERRADLASYYLMDPHSRTPEELASWSKFNREHEEK